MKRATIVIRLHLHQRSLTNLVSVIDMLHQLCFLSHANFNMHRSFHCSSRFVGMQELWLLLASAAENQSGIPQKLLDDQAAKIAQKKEMQEKINVSSTALETEPSSAITSAILTSTLPV